MFTVPHVVLSVGDVMCTVKCAPDTRLAIVHVSTPLLMPQVAPPSSATVQDKPAFVGSVSVIETLVASPWPVFVTVILNPIEVPALTVPWSATFATSIAGQRTVTEASSLAWPSLVVVTEAVLSTVPHVALVVGEVMCTVKCAPESSDAIVQVSTPPLMPQVAPPSSATVQDRPASVGSVSVIDTPVAAPAPMFVTLILKPMSVPALTLPASAVLSIAMLAHSTSVEAESCGEPSLCDAVTVAVLSYVPQLSFVVWLVTCTVKLAPDASTDFVQVRVFDAMLHVAPPSSATDQLMPVLVGSGSVSDTLFAGPGPLFVTLILNPMSVPALTLAASAVLSMARSGNW